MKKTEVKIDDKIEIISAKASLLVTNLVKIHFVFCILAVYLFLYDLFVNDNLIIADSYLISAMIIGVFLVILIRYFYLYFVYKKSTKRIYISKDISSINCNITYKEKYLIVDNGKEKEKIDYKNIVFIGKVDLIYFITYFDSEIYKISPIGNVGSDDSIVNELIGNCQNLKLKRILSYNSKKILCIIIFILLFLMFVINIIRFVLSYNELLLQLKNIFL